MALLSKHYHRMDLLKMRNILWYPRLEREGVCMLKAGASGVMWFKMLKDSRLGQ